MNSKKKNFGNVLQKRSRFSLPYYGKDLVKWYYRFVRGPTTKSKENIQYIPKRFALNILDSKKPLTIVFIGDIMELKERDLVIGNGIREFIKNADYVIGNFEGTITNEARLYMDQRHKLQIIDALTSLFQPEQFFLSMANNHSGDFGRSTFRKSIKLLEDSGFTTFGTIDRPFVDIADTIRIIAGTAWSNRPCEYIVNFFDTPRYINPDLFNILYAHWGYELYCYPNKEMVQLAKAYLDDFGAIIGHHSHAPQPVTYEKYNGINKLVGYSLGDFSYGDDYPKNNLENYRYGIILKVQVGEDVKGHMNVGEIIWEFIASHPYENDSFIVEIIDTLPILEKKD